MIKRCVRLTFLLSIAIAAPLSILAAGDPFELRERFDPWVGEEYPPGFADLLAADGTWEQLNSAEPDLMVIWGDLVVASFQGFPGLWLYEDGRWTALTPATPYSLTIVCRNVVAAFEGWGLGLYDGNGWTQLTPSEPVEIVPKGQTGLVANFGPGLALWEYECPASVACAFLDGTTWNLVETEAATTCDPQGEIVALVGKLRLDGDLVYFSSYEDLTCQGEDDETFVLLPDCSFVQSDVRITSLGDPWDCTETTVEGNWGRFTENQLHATYQEPTTYEGPNCPEWAVGCDYRGGTWGTPCDPEICWPCDEVEAH